MLALCFCFCFVFFFYFLLLWRMDCKISAAPLLHASRDTDHAENDFHLFSSDNNLTVLYSQ